MVEAYIYTIIFRVRELLRALATYTSTKRFEARL